MTSRALYLKPSIESTQPGASSASCSFASRGQQLAIFVPPLQINGSYTNTQARRTKESHVWCVQAEKLEDSRRQFVSQAFLIFAHFKRTLLEFTQRGPEFINSNEAIIRYSEHCQSYIDLIRQHLNPDSDSSSKLPEKEQNTLECIYTALELFQVVYLPSHGYLGALVARELLLWLNTNYVAETEEDGATLVNLEKPWASPNFWPYIKLCTLRVLLTPVKHFMAKVTKEHPDPPTREICSYMLQALDEMPSSEDYDHEADFFHAHRAWKTSLHRVRRAVDKHSRSRFDGKEDLEEIILLLEGKPEVVIRLCSSSGFGWKEAICVWGIWINERLKRTDLPEIATELLDELPVDPTSIEDLLHSALLSGDATKATSYANDLDLWLVAHLVDLMEPLDLLEQPVIANLRQHFIVTYADSLMADPALWRVTVEYLATCGSYGLQMASVVLSHVPLGILEDKPPSQSTSLPGQEHSTALVLRTPDTLEELLVTCTEHGLQETKHNICRTAARMFTLRKQYGRAIEYCAQSLDMTALARVVESLLNEYIERGPATFVELVDQIPAHFLYPDLGNAPRELFSSRLHFVVKYAEFHHTVSHGRKADAAGDLAQMFKQEVVPKTWWSLLLKDASDLLSDEEIVLSAPEVHILLSKLEEISTKSRFGAGGDYLTALKRHMGIETDENALQQLDIARLRLVRYVSRCMTSGIGGRGPVWDESS